MKVGRRAALCFLQRTEAVASRKQTRKLTRGHTLQELLVVVAIMGILAAIAAPSGLALYHTSQANTARSQVHQIIRQAQREAIRHRVSWQASFRDVNGTVQWAVHPVTTLPALANWQNLNTGVRIDVDATTFVPSSGIYRTQFNHKGHANILGRLTLSTVTSGGKIKRCAVVSTLLGAVRDGRGHPRPDQNGRYCY
ncbi:type II secretion system protein [Leptolyngbya sp. FACHB-541]|uniref:pilus assembly FimT family protein n=1 Tax=Leptolyngbya sp. FACHB-541 TaxID=2692810 RepID=UPI0016868EFE|nr:type II secretion system protein [Leptolyngbya sp. FACHB-541]MBD1999527.1 type II secretion system protein [Leptolyngbya sp. FACHB-541]